MLRGILNRSVKTPTVVQSLQRARFFTSVNASLVRTSSIPPQAQKRLPQSILFPRAVKQPTLQRNFSSGQIRDLTKVSLQELLKGRKIGFLGTGNMAGSLLDAVAQDLSKSDMYACNRTAAKLVPFEDKATIASNEVVIRESRVLILGGKPKDIHFQCKELGQFLKKYAIDPKSGTVISLAAAIPIKSIHDAIGLPGVTVIRAMSTLGIRNRKGVTGLFAGPEVAQSKCHLAEKIFTGGQSRAVWLKSENTMHLWTAAFGSLPGWYSWHLATWRDKILEAALQEGDELDPNQIIECMLLAIEGTHANIAKEGNDPETVQRNVTTPSGTTDAAVKTFEDENTDIRFGKAIKAATDRSKEMAEQYGVKQETAPTLPLRHRL